MTKCGIVDLLDIFTNSASKAVCKAICIDFSSSILLTAKVKPVGIKTIKVLLDTIYAFNMYVAIEYATKCIDEPINYDDNALSGEQCSLSDEGVII